MSPKVSVLKKRGHFLSQKVSGKGSLLILENDHTSSLLQMSGGTGVSYYHVKHIRNIYNEERVTFLSYIFLILIFYWVHRHLEWCWAGSPCHGSPI